MLLKIWLCGSKIEFTLGKFNFRGCSSLSITRICTYYVKRLSKLTCWSGTESFLLKSRKKKGKKSWRLFSGECVQPAIVVHRGKTFSSAGLHFCFSYTELLFLNCCTLILIHLLVKSFLQLKHFSTNLI